MEVTVGSTKATKKLDVGDVVVWDGMGVYIVMDDFLSKGNVQLRSLNGLNGACGSHSIEVMRTIVASKPTTIYSASEWRLQLVRKDGVDHA